MAAQQRNESRQSLPGSLNQSEDVSLFPIKPLFFTAFGWWRRSVYASNENKHWRGMHSCIFYTKPRTVGWVDLSQWLMGKNPDVISMKGMTFIAFIPFKLTFRNWSRVSPVYLKCDFSCTHGMRRRYVIEYEIMLWEMCQRIKTSTFVWTFFFEKMYRIASFLCQWKQGSGETLENVKNSLFHH